MASDSPAALEMVLRRAELARANNFDLLGDNGYEALRTELTADFPYLTLGDLNNIIKLGIKGKLDSYKSRPLNFTRVYQWVEQRAVYSEGFWRNKYPVLLAWTDAVGVTRELLAEIDTYETPAPAFVHDYKFRQLVATVIGKACFPGFKSFDEITGMLLRQHPEGARRYLQIREELYPRFAAQHPGIAGHHTPVFP